jgi:glycosyltransferase involved in cell wall biosynthesis
MKSKIVLIANYLKDEQESMERFMQILYTSYKSDLYTVEIIRPPIFFASKIKNTHVGFGKWLAYLDKYILFPFILLRHVIKSRINNIQCIYHICDHSNAMYIQWLPKTHTIITCHDVLAIRGAFGYEDAYCTSSFTGKILQKWILSSLCKAKKIAFVSETTKYQFLELQNIWLKGKVEVNNMYLIIYNGFNADFKVLSTSESRDILLKNNFELETPFLLHVGQGHIRKNRKLLIEMLNQIKDHEELSICFAGKRLDNDLVKLAKEYNILDKIYTVLNPSHEFLVALYNSCNAFVFPSFSEGFGWPLIEAQACGAAVLTSNIQPMMEVSGGGALYADPTKPTSFVEAYNQLQDSIKKIELIEKGSTNASNFSTRKMVDQYLLFYSV